MKPPVTWLELTEYQSSWFPLSMFSEEVGLLLWQRYQKQLEIEFPNPKTGFRWKLRSRGWVGSIPVTKQLGLWLQPRFPITHFYMMFAYAYGGKEWPLLNELSLCDTISAFYKQIAQLLAKKILERLRRGLYKTYHLKRENIATVRGRIDFQQVIRQPPIGKIPCRYEELTVDQEDNQILLWTLHELLRSGWCMDEEVYVWLHQAYNLMRQNVSLKPFTSVDCQNRSYHRLNQDYLLLHSLCRFFLDHLAPVHQRGTEMMLPFFLRMSTLYERFVTEWLRHHLPRDYHLSSQEIVAVGQQDPFSFRIDLVIYQAGVAKYVMDIKYKQDQRPANSDLFQIVAYAYAKRCKEAILVYPNDQIEPIDEYIQEIRVRTISFPLTGDLEENGQTFLNVCLSSQSNEK